MGYYTEFEISVDIDKVTGQKAISKLEKVGIVYTLDEGSMRCKWYDHEDHMTWLSKQFPSVVFRLDGRGDEYDDVWVKWFKNGVMKKWKLEPDIPDGFDPPDGWS